ncbi:MAG TPA: DUF4908 domain-containing protein [Rhizomicrobium sp.]|nr:DUF4908 domain-containing protein [Rhizomicrobium sp.]
MKIVCTSLFLLLAAAPLAQAQVEASPGTPPGMASRLAAGRIGAIQTGRYNAEDNSTFTLDSYGGGKYLLRFTGRGESFVLTTERGSLGVKLLKYDTGTVALRVSVWGGLTLYTQDAPQGVPATYQGPAQASTVLSINNAELQAALNDEANHLNYVQNIALKFSADPAVLASDPETRGRAFDALINAAMGIERFLTATPAARPLLVKRVNSVKVAEGGKPTIALLGQTLLVSFVPGEGHEGHASSLAIQQELGRLFAATPPDMAVK